MSNLDVETNSPAETEALAAKLGRQLAGGTVVTLSGELGAGKTVFVRGLARGLGVPKQVAITSPTYVLLHRYEGGRLTLYHIDAYRIGGGADEFEASGLNECLNDPNAVVCIEWPERVSGLQLSRAPRVEVKLDHLDPVRRKVSMSARGEMVRALG
jgi:tRNA threonylcarbamoyladenosine biosynthesis protein TsaE